MNTEVQGIKESDHDSSTSKTETTESIKTTINYPRGSEWRKWDLQACTKEYTSYNGPTLDSNALDILFHKTGLAKDIINSKHATLSNEDYAKLYVEYLINFTDLSVVAITNHNTGEGIQEIIDYLEIKKKENPSNYNRLTIFPGVEVGGNDRCHILIIFNPNTEVNHKYDFEKDGITIKKTLSWKEYIDKFLNEIKIPIPRIYDGNKPANSSSFGLNDILALSIEWDFIPILPHIYTNDGWYKELQESNRIETFKNSNFGIVDIKSVGNNHALSNILKGTDEKYGNKKIACIKTSDACSFSDIGKFFSWIKGDPTFEGLKQIIYEPEDKQRVDNEAVSPEFEFDKPYFECINIENDIHPYKDDPSLRIAKNKILLNKNLVAIIGGRGEGKSTLINYFGNAFNKLSYENNSENPFSTDPNFFIEYHKINSKDISNEDKKIFNAEDKEQNQLDFVFISQKELYKKIISRHTLSDKLKEILRIEKTVFSPILAQEIDNTIQKIYSLQKWAKVTDEDGNSINSEEFNNTVIKKNKALLDNLKNSKNKEQIDKYNLNLTKISDANKIISTSESILVKINDFLLTLNEDIQNGDKTLFNLPNLTPYKSEISAIAEKYKEKIRIFHEDNDAIKNSLTKEGISGDLTNLLENTKKYQSLINDAQEKLIEIQDKQKILEDTRKKRKALGKKIKENYELQQKEVNTAWDNFLKKHPDNKKDIIKKIILREDSITISGEIIFDSEKFYNLLENILDHRTFKSLKELKDDFKIHDLQSWTDYIETNFDNKFESISEKIKTTFSNLFFNTKIRAEYLRTEAKIKCNGKELEKLSAGQQGTAYLRIQLANSAFSVPIIFDQPEDDLDNKFIMSELVKIFRELKKYRQIIIVTHNANLVVNADAEQIIVANKNDDVFSYNSASLENPKIRRSVCDILEGGDLAFIKREQKYHLVKI
ncbi:MAG: hypothetical protein VB048_06150 [Bacteroidaceae bacterium]|nr:hypothetical protein [Bacteroidaceae bacterium]